MLSSVLFSVYLFMADKLNTMWMLQLIFITFCIINLNSTFMILISKQEYWSGLLFPSPGDLSGPGIEPTSLTYPVFGRQILYHRYHLGSPTLALSLLCVLRRVQFFATLCTVEHQAPLSRGFLGKNNRSGLPFPTPGDLPDPGIKCNKIRQLIITFTTYEEGYQP